jgi:Arc/MetJ-type ribon-helix-helix transcriptional regulator
MEHKSKLVQFRAPPSLSEVIDETASRNFQTRSEYIRRSIVEKLRSDGVKLFEEVQA